MSAPAKPLPSDDEIVGLVQRVLIELVPERAHQFAGLSIDSRVEDLDLDSIAIVQMVGQIEDEIDRAFLPREVAAIRCINDIAVLIRGEAATLAS